MGKSNSSSKYFRRGFFVEISDLLLYGNYEICTKVFSRLENNYPSYYRNTNSNPSFQLLQLLTDCAKRIETLLLMIRPLSPSFSNIYTQTSYPCQSSAPCGFPQSPARVLRTMVLGKSLWLMQQISSLVRNDGSMHQLCSGAQVVALQRTSTILPL